MRDSSRPRLFVLGFVVATLLATVSAPAQAQRAFEPLFDKLNVRVEGSWVSLLTDIRLDSEALGRGTTLSFEDDLDLGSQEIIPTVAFEWQIAKRLKVGIRWQDISRRSNSQALTEIQWGDEVIPVEAGVTLGFDVTQTFIDYAYFPWVKERWAGGFGLGVRWMDIAATLAWESQGLSNSGSTEAKGTGPLPYLYFEYRLLLSDNWRFKAGLGWLQVRIGDIDGGQWVGRADIEYLLGRHWGFGGALNIATIDVDWKGLENEEGDSLYTGAINMDINDVSLFLRFRF